MEKKLEKLSANKAKLTIEISPKEMIKYFDQAFEQLAQSVKVQGFRPGKAPRAMLEAQIGVTRILSDALDLAINDGYSASIREYDLSPISSPSLTISQYPDYGTDESEIKNGLIYTMEFETFPEVKIGDLSDLKVELPKKEEAKEEDLEKILLNLRKQKSNFKEVDRAAKLGDFAEISFEGSVKKVKIDSMCSKHHPLVLGENSLIPGFEDEIVGMTKGEKKEFKIKFPKDYHAKEYAGKEADFSIELLELKEVELPEVDETFAADFGQKDAEALREAIKHNLEHEIEHKYQEDLELRVIDKVLAKVEVEIPEEMVKRETDRMVEGYKQQLQKMGLTFDSYLKSTSKSEDDLRKEMSQTAEKNVKVGLMLGEIIKKEGFDPKDEASGRKAVEYLVKETTK